MKLYRLPILALMAIWCAVFIQRTSFDVAGERYYSLFDDSMITMTYAKNVTQGHGLNWAKYGAPVEGYSSPLWMMVMIPFQWLPIAWGKVSLAFMVFATGLLMLNVVLLDRLLERRMGVASTIVRIAAMLALGFMYPMNYWTLEGMEPGPQVTLFLLGLDLLMAFQTGQARRHLYRLAIVLALALLLRMDMVFFVALCTLWVAPYLIRHPRQGTGYLAVVALPMLAYLGFRWFYFHDLLPNTYYLKLAHIPLDIRLARGWHFLAPWMEHLWMLWIVVAASTMFVVKQRIYGFIIALIMSYLAYNVYVGGDAWEDALVGANRFTVIVLPLVILLIAAGGYAWCNRGGILAKLHIAFPVFGCLVCFVFVNGLLFVPFAGLHRKQFALINLPYNTEYQMWNTQKAVSMNAWLGPEDRVAVVQAGGFGYFSEYQLVDFLGFNDRHIARLEPYCDLDTLQIARYVPGHVKVDYAYAIGECAPDYIADVWTRYSPATEVQFQALLVANDYVPSDKGGWIKSDFHSKPSK